MNPPEPGRSSGVASGAVALGLLGAASSDLAQVSPLLWTMIAISAAGAIVTFAILAYALHKFRDPSTRRRRYG